MPAFARARQHSAGDRAGHRRHGPKLRRAPLGRVAQSGPAAPGGQLQPAGHHYAAAESGGLVHFYHRPGAGPARHLRFRASQSGHAGALLFHGTHRGTALHAAPGALPAAALRLAAGFLSPRHGLLADAGGPRHSRHRGAHAHQLSAAPGGPRALRHGHSRPARHAGNIYALLRRPRGNIAPSFGRPGGEGAPGGRPRSAAFGRPT